MTIMICLNYLHQLGNNNSRKISNHASLSNTLSLAGLNKIIVSLYREKYITKLLDIHVFQDSEFKIGSAILELGRLDTIVLTLSKNQAVKDLQQIPDNRGSTLYRLLTDPDNVNLEYLSADLFAVSTLV